MSTRLLSTILSLSCVLGLSACDEAAEPESTRSFVFDAEDINAELEADPNAVFFVDLRADTVYTFNQRVEGLDYDHFMVQCPSMPAPVPMADFNAMLGNQLNLDSEYWMLGSWEAETNPFRAASGTFPEPQEGMNCSNEICNEGGGDCTWECSY